MQPGQPQEVEPRDLRDAAILAGHAVLIEDRSALRASDVQPTEVGAVAGGPDDARNAGLRQIQLARLRRLESDRLAVVRRRHDSGPLDIWIYQRPEVRVEVPVGKGEAHRQVRAQSEPVAVDAVQVAEEGDPVVRHQAQVRVVAAAVT